MRYLPIVLLAALAGCMIPLTPTYKLAGYESSTAWHAAIDAEPEAVRADLRAGRVKHGMTANQVRLAIGRPQDITPLPGGGAKWTYMVRDVLEGTTSISNLVTFGPNNRVIAYATYW